MDPFSIFLSPKPGRIDRILCAIAGADPETLRKCSDSDRAVVRTLAVIMLCVDLYQTFLLSAFAHLLFGSGRFHPEFVLVAAFIATFIMFVDSYTIMRSGWALRGVEELRRAGLDIRGGLAERSKIVVSLIFRLLFAFGIAQCCALCIGLGLFSADIEGQIDRNHLAALAPIVVVETQRMDADIARAREAVAKQDAQVASLAAEEDALIQKSIDPQVSGEEIAQAQAEVATLLGEATRADEEAQKAQDFATNEAAGIKAAAGNSGQIGEGVRYRAARERADSAKKRADGLDQALDAAHARVDTLRAQLTSAGDALRQRTQGRLPDLDAALAVARTRQAELNTHLAAVVRNRDAAIDSAVKASPSYVRRNDGFLAQISALKQLADSNATLKLVILLIEFTSLALELAAVLAKITSFVPTLYAALIVRNTYMDTARLVVAMDAELNPQAPVKKGPPSPANDNKADASAPPTAPTDPDGDPPPPPKRPRGRPRKTQAG